MAVTNRYIVKRHQAFLMGPEQSALLNLRCDTGYQLETMPHWAGVVSSYKHEVKQRDLKGNVTQWSSVPSELAGHEAVFTCSNCARIHRRQIDQDQFNKLRASLDDSKSRRDAGQDDSGDLQEVQVNSGNEQRTSGDVALEENDSLSIRKAPRPDQDAARQEAQG